MASNSTTIKFDLKLTPEENEILTEQAKASGQSKASILKRSLYMGDFTANSWYAPNCFPLSQVLQMLYRMEKKLDSRDIDGAREEVLKLCDTLSL